MVTGSLKNYTLRKPTSWEAKIEGKITFENPVLLTIELNTYLFTGGAHGYTSRRFLNFDKTKGKELENWQLFRDRVDFEKFAELKVSRARRHSFRRDYQ